MRTGPQVAGALGALALIVFAVVTALRVTYPFPLEWQEGALLEHARRVAAGVPVYVAPGLDFAPFPYPPLFHGCAALALTLFGDGLPAARSVSVLATLALLALVAREGGRHGAALGLFGAGLCAAGAGVGGWFLDLARVDALALALTLGAAFAARRARTGGQALGAALIACLAVLAKQTALLPCAALVVPLAARSWRLALAYGLTCVGVLALVAIVGDLLTDGWSTFTVIELLAGSPWHSPAVLGFWREAALAYAPCIALACVVGRPAWRAALSEPFVPALCVGLVAAAWLGRAHVGGYDNTLLPLVLAVALWAPRLCAASGRPSAAWLAALAVAWLAVVGGDPRAVVPTAAERAQMERALDALRALPAPAFVPDAPDLAARAGHPRALHQMALIDLLQSGEDDVAGAFVRRLEAALDARVFGAIVLDAPWPDLPALDANYVLASELAVPIPRSGAPRVPRLVYLRR